MKDDPQNTTATFGANMRARRTAEGWSQDHLARLMREQGFGSWRQSTVAKQEAGERPLRLAEAMMLTALFRSTLSQMLTVVTDEDRRAAGDRLLKAKWRVDKCQEAADEAQAVVTQVKRELRQRSDFALQALLELDAAMSDLREAQALQATTGGK